MRRFFEIRREVTVHEETLCMYDDDAVAAAAGLTAGANRAILNKYSQKHSDGESTHKLL